jgi:hypothetical protein
MMIRLEWHRKLSSLKHCLLIGVRRCSVCESMDFVENWLMKAGDLSCQPALDARDPRFQPFARRTVA